MPLTIGGQSLTAKTFATQVKEGNLQLGPTIADFLEIGSVVSIGLTSNNISITRNTTRTQLMSDQLRGRYGSSEAEVETLVETSMDEFGLYNIALAWSLPASQITGAGSSILSIDATTTNPYRSMQIATTQPKVTSGGSAGNRVYKFYKVKVFSAGPIVLSRTDKTLMPIQVECYVNDVDVTGNIKDSVIAGAAPAWE